MDAVGGFSLLQEKESDMSRFNGNGRPQGQPPPQQQYDAPENEEGGGRQKPKFQLQIGAIKCVVWANQGKDGEWYSIAFSRSYLDSQKNWKSADSFGADNLLVLAKLAERAWELIAKEKGGNLS
jgi:hypothetical protein